MIVEAIRALLRDCCTPAQVRALEAGSDNRTLWTEIERNGFLELMAVEARGGAAMRWDELFPVLLLLGEYIVPAPLAQTIIARLVLPAHIAPPAGQISFGGRILPLANGWQCMNVAYGATTQHVIAMLPRGGLVLANVAGARRERTGIFGSLCADLHWHESLPVGLPKSEAVDLHLLGAAMHAALLAGAMTRVLEITLQFAGDRSQFGKTIGKFQAVQQQLSVMAENIAAARVAAEIPFAGRYSLTSVAVAKSRCSEAAALVASIAHAVHGAIGVTREYDLQLYSRRLHEWRIADGAEGFWNQRLGEYLLAKPRSSLSRFAISLAPV